MGKDLGLQLNVAIEMALVVRLLLLLVAAVAAAAVDVKVVSSTAKSRQAWKGERAKRRAARVWIDRRDERIKERALDHLHCIIIRRDIMDGWMHCTRHDIVSDQVKHAEITKYLNRIKNESLSRRESVCTMDSLSHEQTNKRVFLV